MASSKRKKHGAGYVVLIAVLILVLLAVVAAVTGYSLVARRVKALQAGAAFTFDYEITSTADSPALYTILQKTGSTKGTVNGLYAPDALQLSISAPDAVIPAGPLTRVYISSSETLYDVGQLYKNIRSSITGSYPLASLLLPDWSLGSYISQAQLASRKTQRTATFIFSWIPVMPAPMHRYLLSGWKRAGSLRMPSRCTSCSPSRNTGSASSSLAP